MKTVTDIAELVKLYSVPRKPAPLCVVKVPREGAKFGVQGANGVKPK